MGLTGLMNLTDLTDLTDLTGLTSLKDLIYSRGLSLGCSSFLPHNHPCSSEGHPVVLKERSDRLCG